MKNLILYVYFSLIICIFAAKLLFNMMKKMLYFAITAVLMAACGSKQQKDDNVPNDAISIYQRAIRHSTVWLATDVQIPYLCFSPTLEATLTHSTSLTVANNAVCWDVHTLATL